MTDGNKMVENKKDEHVPFQLTAILTFLFVKIFLILMGDFDFLDITSIYIWNDVQTNCY